MRFLELQLRAYGPFTNRTLDLSKGRSGLHLIYGPNEAGKSSGLRALGALLYGIPLKRTDTFLHKEESLRIGARLQHSDGSVIEVIRRGKKPELLDFDENPLDSSILARYLNGIDRDTFCRLFGINYKVLDEGAQAILAGKGSAGESLFSAGLGGSGIRETLESLEREASEFYKPRGRADSYLILRAAKEYADSMMQVKSLALSSDTWAGHENALKKTRRDREELLSKLNEKQVQISRLERLERALPRVALRNQVISDLSDLGEVVPLPSDFPERRRDAQRTLNAATQGLHDVALALDNLEAQIQELQIPGQVTSSGDDIERLFQRLGSVRKGAEERRVHDGKRQQLRNEARAILSGELKIEKSLDEAKALRPSTRFKARMQELGNQYQALEAEVRRSAAEVIGLEQSIQKGERDLTLLKPSRDPSELRRVIKGVQRQGALEKLLKGQKEGLQKKEMQAEGDLKRLGLWTGSMEALESLAVPMEQTITRFEDTFDRIGRREEDNTGKQAGLVLELTGLAAKMSEHRLAGETPSEEELAASRTERDRTWGSIRRRYIDVAPVNLMTPSATHPSTAPSALEPRDTEDASGLPEQFEQQVGRADLIADRLRREADRVATYASLVSQQLERERVHTTLRAEMDQIAKERDRINREWNATWSPSGIAPLPPREMQDWLRRQQKLSQQVAELRALRAEVAESERIVADWRDALGAALLHVGEVALDAGLDATLEYAVSIADEIEKTELRRNTLAEQLEKDHIRLAPARVASAHALVERQNWKTAWAEHVSVLQLDAESTPSVANAVQARFDDFFKKIDDADQLERRIDEIDKETERFENEVKPLLERVAPDLLELAPEKAVESLNARLTTARQDEATLTQLEMQRSEKHRQRAEYGATQERARSDLQTLCRQAQCEDPEQLPVHEQRSACFVSLSDEQATLERLLLEDGQGLSLDQLTEEASTVDGAKLPGQVNELQNEVQKLEAKRTELERTIGAEENELKKMNGISQASDAAQTAHSKLAELREGVERYLKLRLAIEMLKREIERYRKQNQDWLLARASKLFANLTLGSFDSLQIAYTAKREPVLRGQRPNKDTVDVEGMSEGARDQLFLSLRLASLEQYLDQNEAMPFIVDDILIQFDDHRSEAALKELASLSNKTQVLFFTHHHRILELAERAVPEVLHVHSLG